METVDVGRKDRDKILSCPYSAVWVAGVSPRRLAIGNV